MRMLKNIKLKTAGCLYLYTDKLIEIGRDTNS